MGKKSRRKARQAQRQHQSGQESVTKYWNVVEEEEELYEPPGITPHETLEQGEGEGAGQPRREEECASSKERESDLEQKNENGKEAEALPDEAEEHGDTTEDEIETQDYNCYNDLLRLRDALVFLNTEVVEGIKQACARAEKILEVHDKTKTSSGSGSASASNSNS